MALPLIQTGGGVSANGSSIEVPTAGYTSPTPVYTPVESPSSLNPAIYVQDVNGYWHAQAGIDTTTVTEYGSGPLPPAGILTWTRRQNYRDSLSNEQSFKNSFMSVNHVSCVGTANTNQDRALGSYMTNITGQIYQFSIISNVVTFYLQSLQNGLASDVGFQPGMVVIPTGLAVGTYLNNQQLTVTSVTAVSTLQQNVSCSFTYSNVSLTSDTGSLDQTMYSMAPIQCELDIFGTPVIGAGVDTEFSALSAQCSDSTVGTKTGPGLGVNVARFNYFREGSGIWGSINPTCLKCIVQNDSLESGNSQTLVGIDCQVFDTNGHPTDIAMIGVQIDSPLHSGSETRFPDGNMGLHIKDYGTAAGDYAILVDGGVTQLGGPVLLPSLSPISGTMDCLGSFVNNGSTSSAITSFPSYEYYVNGPTGSTTYVYYLVLRDSNGGALASSSITITNGPATLSSSDSIGFELVLAPLGPAAVEIWRTTGGTSQGKIGEFSLSAVSYTNFNSVLFFDTGLAATAGTVPSGNSTGSIVAQGPIGAGQYTVANLPTGVEGWTAYATNGRKVGEGAGSGTGVPVYYSNGHWRVYSTDAAVSA